MMKQIIQAKNIKETYKKRYDNSILYVDDVRIYIVTRGLLDDRQRKN